MQSSLAIFSSLTQELGEQLVSLSKGHNGKVRIGGERVWEGVLYYKACLDFSLVVFQGGRVPRPVFMQPGRWTKGSGLNKYLFRLEMWGTRLEYVEVATKILEKRRRIKLFLHSSWPSEFINCNIWRGANFFLLNFFFSSSFPLVGWGGEHNLKTILNREFELKTYNWLLVPIGYWCHDKDDHNKGDLNKDNLDEDHQNKDNTDKNNLNKEKNF